MYGRKGKYFLVVASLLARHDVVGISLQGDDEDRNTNDLPIELRNDAARERTISQVRELQKDAQEEPVSFLGMFRFHDRQDIALTYVGSLASILVYGNSTILGLLISEAATVIFSDTEDNDYEDEIFDKLVQLTWAIALVTVGIFILSSFCFYVLSHTAERVTNRLRFLYIEAVLRQDVSFFDLNDPQVLSEKIETDLNHFLEALSGGLFGLLKVKGRLLTGFKLAVITNWFVTMLFLSECIVFKLAVVKNWFVTMLFLSVLPLMIVSTVAFTKFSTAQEKENVAQYSRAGALVEEVLFNFRTVVAFGAEPHEAMRYSSLLHGSRISTWKLHTASVFYENLMYGLTAFGFAFLVWYGGNVLIPENKTNPVTDDPFTGDDVLSTFLILMFALTGFGETPTMIRNFSKGSVAASAIFSTIDSEPLIEPKTEDYKQTTLPQDLKNFEVLKFEDVHFVYPSRPTQPVLTGMNFTIERGDKVAIVGASGAGKSTIISLIERFYDPVDYNVLDKNSSSSGRITVNGRNLKDVPVLAWRRTIGYVGQDPVLSSATIMENIRMGNPSANDREVFIAAQQARADKFINNFPERYQTYVGNSGTALSGGQKQRIAIARALIKNPSILLLDEATSSLDHESEKLVQATLDDLTYFDVTVITVAHRHSTIRASDKILFLSDGRVAQGGTHEDLMALQGGYYNFVESNETQESSATEVNEVKHESSSVEQTNEIKPVQKKSEVPANLNPNVSSGNIGFESFSKGWSRRTSASSASGTRSSEGWSRRSSFEVASENTITDNKKHRKKNGKDHDGHLKASLLTSTNQSSSYGSYEKNVSSVTKVSKPQPVGSHYQYNDSGSSSHSSEEGKDHVIPGSGYDEHGIFHPDRVLPGSGFDRLGVFDPEEVSSEYIKKRVVDKGMHLSNANIEKERRTIILKEGKYKISRKRLLSYTNPEICWWPVFILLSLLLGAVLPLIAYLYYKGLVDLTGCEAHRDEDGEIFENNACINEVEDDSITIVWFAVGIGLACVFGSLALGALQGYLAGWSTLRIRTSVFAAVLRQEVAWHEHKDQDSGINIASCLFNSSSAVSDMLAPYLSVMIRGICALVTSLLISLVASARVLFLTLAAIFFVWLALRLIEKKTKKVVVRREVIYSQASFVASEGILNIRTIKALNAESPTLKTYTGKVTAPYSEVLKSIPSIAIARGFGLSMYYTFIMIVPFGFGALLIRNGTIEPKMFFLALVSVIWGPSAWQRTLFYLPDEEEGKIAAFDVFKLIDRKSIIDIIHQPNSERCLTMGNGTVTFKNVEFHYPNRPKRTVLRNISFSVKFGTTNAIVGPSGSGKSAILQLLLRFYDVTLGSVSVGGTDLDYMDLRWWRSIIGYVGQESILFDMSVEDNIKYGNPNATPDEVLKAARCANVVEFCGSKQEGKQISWTDFVGVRGHKLSGGQKQRIAIARALVRNPFFLILDEATSALDSKSEAVVQRALDIAVKVRGSLTTFVVAHRLSTIENADQIFVMKRGKLVDQGTHDELMEKGGMYSHLVRRGRK